MCIIVMSEKKMSEFRKIQLEQRKLDSKLDEIAAKRAREFQKQRYPSYCMHTPPEVLDRLAKGKRK